MWIVLLYVLFCVDCVVVCIVLCRLCCCMYCFVSIGLFYVLFCVDCVVLCIVLCRLCCSMYCFVLIVLFVCKCVLYYCHWVATQLQLTNIISYNVTCFMSGTKSSATSWWWYPNHCHQEIKCTFLCTQFSDQWHFTFPLLECWHWSCFVAWVPVNFCSEVFIFYFVIQYTVNCVWFDMYMS